MLICARFFSLQHLGDLLYRAATDGGYVDPHKVAEILGVPNTRSEVLDNISGKKTTFKMCCMKKHRKTNY